MICSGWKQTGLDLQPATEGPHHRGARTAGHRAGQVRHCNYLQFVKITLFPSTIHKIQDQSLLYHQPLSSRELRAMHGAESVVLSDIVRPDAGELEKGED